MKAIVYQVVLSALVLGMVAIVARADYESKCLEEYTKRTVYDILTKEAKDAGSFRDELLERAKVAFIQYEKLKLERRGFTDRYGQAAGTDYCPPVIVWKGETIEGPKEAASIIAEVRGGLSGMFARLSNKRRKIVE